MTRADADEARRAAERFCPGGPPVSVEPWGSGHIHDTFLAVTQTAEGPSRFVLQRINRDVFPSPSVVMDNVARVTAHLREKILRADDDPTRRVLTIVPTVDGRDFLETSDGQCWRGFEFIDNARTHDVARDPDHIEQVARAFARYVRDLQDLPEPPLRETIPGFCELTRRYTEFLDTVEADEHRRSTEAGDEIAFVESRKNLVLDAEDRLRGLPRRVVHYDTKINNVMIDVETGEGICVIDLDTTMPGTVLHDFGDLVRSGACPAAEDERDLSRVRLDPDLFRGIARGYLDVLGDSLAAEELDLLVHWARVVTFAVGVRFLTDHLAGDVYFRIHRPGQNLDRCRTQLALVRELETRDSGLREIVTQLQQR